MIRRHGPIKADPFPTEDLGLVPTEKLIGALAARSATMIVVCVETGTHGPDTEGHWTRWKGNAVLCQGLAAEMTRDLQDYIREPLAEDGR